MGWMENNPTDEEVQSDENLWKPQRSYYHKHQSTTKKKKEKQP